MQLSFTEKKNIWPAEETKNREEKRVNRNALDLFIQISYSVIYEYIS